MVVDLNAQIVEVYRDPAADGYSRVTRHAANETIAPEALPDTAVELRAVIG